MRKTLLVGIALLALALAIPNALCEGLLPPGPPWPETEWIPKSPEEARPKLPDGSPMKMIKPWRIDNPAVEEFEPFYIYTGWAILPTKVAWDAETGDPVVPYESIAYRTGSAEAIYLEVTIDGEPLGQPTYSYYVIAKWCRFYNNAEISAEEIPPWPLDDWAVAPLAKREEHYYVFPEGLPAGTYALYTRALHTSFGQWEGRGLLTVEATTTP